MDRGRPKKRADGSPIKRSTSKRAASSEEVKAFETLPQGYRAVDAPSLLPATEIEFLRKQAIGQASRFEVLGSKDVEALSRVRHPIFPSNQSISSKLECSSAIPNRLRWVECGSVEHKTSVDSGLMARFMLRRLAHPIDLLLDICQQSINI